MDSVFCRLIDFLSFSGSIACSEKTDLMLSKPLASEDDALSTCIIGMIIGKGEKELIFPLQIQQSLNIPRMRTKKKAAFGLVIIFSGKHTFQIKIEQTITARIARKLLQRMIVLTGENIVIALLFGPSSNPP